MRLITRYSILLLLLAILIPATGCSVGIEKLIVQAQRGEATAQFNLGVMYDNGEGVEEDDERSVYWFRKAAEQGLATAQNNLGVMYDNGEGVEEDDERAVYWFRKAAEQGLATAQFNLGAMYGWGAGIEHSDTRAFYWYKKAAEQGHAGAQNNLGWMYQNGAGVEQSNTRAVYWYRKAAEQGDTHGKFSLGAMYHYGKGVEQSDTRAVYWYGEAVEHGGADAQYRLGQMYDHGEGVESDDKKAVYWYRKAAEQGLADAQHRLGWMYRNGEGVERDYKKTVYWFRKAAEQDDVYAQNNLGEMYRDGEGVERDVKQAVYWFRKAAEQDNVYAQNNLGEMYRDGEGVEQSDEQAVYWFRKAAVQGHAEAQNNLQRMDRDGEGVEQSDQQALQEGAQERKEFDDDIPQLLKRREQAELDKRKWLFVIGAGEYKETSDILYSRRSAVLFARVASKTLGIAPSRSTVLLDKDATSGRIEDQLTLMLRKIQRGDTLYFYYSGHGVPVPTEQNAPYMLATDHIPDFIHGKDYFKLENIYQTLSESGAKVVVFMDSCFTGRTDDESVFGSDKGAVRLKPKKLSISTEGKLAVITAGTGEQFSNALPSRGHRLFSYYLMKAMLEGHTKISTLYDNVSSEVHKESLNLGGLKEQKPVFQGNRDLTL